MLLPTHKFYLLDADGINPRAYPIVILSTLFLCCVIGTGCNLLKRSGPKLDYKTVAESPLKDAATAQERHDDALKALSSGKDSIAEQLVQESLLADVSFGPAHNTLGKIFFDQKKYYFAAWEFEYAIKSMPERPEPHNNLGLVYEAVGRLDDAIGEFQIATDLDPQNPQYLGNFLRAKIRSGTEPYKLAKEFERLMGMETRPVWRTWYEEKLVFSKQRESKKPVDESAGSTNSELLPLPD